MSASMIGVIGLILMLVLIFAGVELGFAFVIAGFIGVTVMLGFDGALTILNTIPLSQAMTYSLSVLPMFMLMGDFAVTGRLTTDAFFRTQKSRPGGNVNSIFRDFRCYLRFSTGNCNGYESGCMAGNEKIQI